MTTPARIAAFVAVLAVAGGGAALAGSGLDPLRGDGGDAPAQGSGAGQHTVHGGPGGAQTP